MPLFDLIYEPWIGVLRTDGTEAFVGLKEALTEAHLFRAVRDPMPTVEFGLYRLLSALVLDIFFIDGYDEDEPPTLRDLREVLCVGHFTPDRIAKIAAYFAKYAHLFNLFDEENPFLQTAHMDTGTAKEKEVNPLARLVPLHPSGTNTNHFHRAHEADFAVSPAAAAGLLTTIAPFMTAGGNGLYPSVNGAPPWYCLVQGQSLFETICLNICLLPEHMETPGLPAWRYPRRVSEEKLRAKYAEALTWRPRRIQLISGPSGNCSLTKVFSDTMVRTMYFVSGDGSDYSYKDPSAAYESKGKEGNLKPLKPTKNRRVWRDAGALFLLRKSNAKRSERPRVIDQFALLFEYETEKELNVILFGMQTDKAKVLEWQREPLSLSSKLLWNEQMHQYAEEEIGRAEKVADEIQKAVNVAYSRDQKNKKGATHIGQAQRAFWDGLQSEYFHLLDTLAPLEEEQDGERRKAIQTWADTMRQVAWNVFDKAIDDLNANADALQREAKARRDFAIGLAKILPREKDGK